MEHNEEDEFPIVYAPLREWAKRHGIKVVKKNRKSPARVEVFGELWTIITPRKTSAADGKQILSFLYQVRRNRERLALGFTDSDGLKWLRFFTFGSNTVNIVRIPLWHYPELEKMYDENIQKNNKN